LDKPGSRRNGRFSENIFFDAALALNFAGTQSHRVEAFRRDKASAWCPGGTFFESISGVLPFLAAHIHSTSLALLRGW